MLLSGALPGRIVFGSVSGGCAAKRLYHRLISEAPPEPVSLFFTPARPTQRSLSSPPRVDRMLTFG